MELPLELTVTSAFIGINEEEEEEEGEEKTPKEQFFFYGVIDDRVNDNPKFVFKNGFQKSVIEILIAMENSSITFNSYYTGDNVSKNTRSQLLDHS